MRLTFNGGSSTARAMYEEILVKRKIAGILKSTNLVKKVKSGLSKSGMLTARLTRTSGKQMSGVFTSMGDSSRRSGSLSSSRKEELKMSGILNFANEIADEIPTTSKKENKIEHVENLFNEGGAKQNIPEWLLKIPFFQRLTSKNCFYIWRSYVSKVKKNTIKINLNHFKLIVIF